MALACSYLHLNSWDWGLLRPKDTPLSEGPCRTRNHPQQRSPSRKVSWRGDLLRVFQHLFLLRWKWGACPQGLAHATLRFETKLGDHRVTEGDHM